MMRKVLLLLACLLGVSCLKAAEGPFIRIGTKDTDLIYKVGDDGRLYQCTWGSGWPVRPIGTTCPWRRKPT